MRASRVAGWFSILIWVSACGVNERLPRGWGEIEMDADDNSALTESCLTGYGGNPYMSSFVKVSRRDRESFDFEYRLPFRQDELVWALEGCVVTDRRGTSVDFDCPGYIRPESLTGDPATRPVMARATGTFRGPTGVILHHEIELLENICAPDDEMCTDRRPEGCTMSFSNAYGTAALPDEE